MTTRPYFARGMPAIPTSTEYRWQATMHVEGEKNVVILGPPRETFMEMLKDFPAEARVTVIGDTFGMREAYIVRRIKR